MYLYLHRSTLLQQDMTHTVELQSMDALTMYATVTFNHLRHRHRRCHRRHCQWRLLVYTYVVRGLLEGQQVCVWNSASAIRFSPRLQNPESNLERYSLRIEKVSFHTEVCVGYGVTMAKLPHSASWH